MEFGTYYAGGKLDRVTYATTIFGYAKELELTYGEKELTEKLADHFKQGIRHAFNGQQVKSKNTLFQILTDYDNDDKRAQNRKTNRDQNKGEVKSDDRNDKYNQNPNHNSNVNDNPPRKSWQTRNINATQIHNKNRSAKHMTEKHTPPANNKTMQKAHEHIDILGVQIEASFRKLNVVASLYSENMHTFNSRHATALKFPNKIELLSAALIDVKEDLAFDIDPMREITEYS